MKHGVKLNPLKVIFLDIDGVLNTARAHIAFGSSQWDPVGVAILNRVCKETGAKLVISSVWRGSMENWMHAHQILDAVGLGRHGICHSQLGFPEYDRNSQSHRTAPGHDNPRGRKIQDWLDEYSPDNYVILDDDCDMLSSQAKHFVKCNGHEGIGYAQYDRMVSILGAKKDEDTIQHDPNQMVLPLPLPDDVDPRIDAKSEGVWKGTFSCEFTGIHAFSEDHAEDVMKEMIMEKLLTDWNVKPSVERMTPEEYEASNVPMVFGDRMDS